MENKTHRPPIETLACPYSDCHLYARRAAGNLTVRKLYGKDQIRYLRCRACAREFSERKNTALFNSKIEERRAVSVAEHLAEGLSTKATSRLVGVSAEAVRRLRRNLAEHARDFHDEVVQDLEATSVQMDERYGYVGSKKEPLWEATAIEPKSRLLISFVVGRRDESLIRELMESTKRRINSPKDLVLMSDGQKSYESLFPSIFGEPYHPARKGDRGRFPKERHRINRSLAHLQLIKCRRRRGRVVEVRSKVAHGSWKRVEKELKKLGYNKPNLSAIERQNGTSRRMNAYLARRSLAFGRTREGREALGWWSTVVYNFCRTQRGLRVALSSRIERRRRYEQRTPAMAAGLTDFIWSIADVLCQPVYPARGPG
jgi:IS1 family transposase/transposase-like protein